jgi:predicted secreted protein
MVVGPTVEADFRGASMASLTLNDTVDLTTGVVTIARWKPSLAGYEDNTVAMSSNDIFSTNTSGRWQRVADILIDNRRDKNVTSFSSEQGPQFQVIMTKTKNGNGGYEHFNFTSDHTLILLFSAFTLTTPVSSTFLTRMCKLTFTPFNSRQSIRPNKVKQTQI